MASHEVITRSKTRDIPATVPVYTTVPVSAETFAKEKFTMATSEQEMNMTMSQDMQAETSVSYAMTSPISTSVPIPTISENLQGVFSRWEQYRPFPRSQPLPGLQTAPSVSDPQLGYRPEQRHYTASEIGGGDIAPEYPAYRVPFTPKTSVASRPFAGPVRGNSSSSAAGYHQNIRMRSPVFNGKMKWSTFIRQFEAVAVGCCWSDEDRLVNLWSSLSDQAPDYAFELEPEILENYDALVLQLERRFRVSQTRETSQRLFYARMLNSGENVKSYAADLKALIHKAYPHGLTVEVREDMLLKQFFDGLRDEEARYCVKYLQRPRSLDEAVDLIVEYQSYRRSGRSGVSTPHRQHVRIVAPSGDEFNDSPQPTAEDDDNTTQVRAVFPGKKAASTEISSLCENVKELTKIVSQLVEKQAAFGNKFSKSRDLSKIQCFSCQAFGHYSRECPSKRESSEANTRRDKVAALQPIARDDSKSSEN